MDRFNPKTILLLLLTFSLVGAISCSRSPDSQPLEFTLTFKNAKNLQPKQFLVYKGLRVGEVSSVELDAGGAVSVQVEVFPQYRDTMYREAVFTIEKPNGVADLSGERQVTISDRGSVRTPIQQNDIIEGTEGLLDRITTTVKEKAGEVIDAVAKTIDRQGTKSP